MDSAPLDLLGVLLVLMLAIIAGFISGKRSPFRHAARLGSVGLAFLVLAAATAWLFGYTQADVQRMYLLKQGNDLFSVGSSVVLGYALILGSAVHVVRAWLANRSRHAA